MSKMIEGPTNPMEIAGKVLKLETLLLVNKTPSINVRGAMILDRWALNEPEKLKALEDRSQTGLLMRVIGQQRKEAEILESPKALEMLRNGLVAHEVLEMHGVSMAI
jgi:hypothetical protein